MVDNCGVASAGKIPIVEMNGLNDIVYVATNDEFCSIEKADGEFTRVKCVLLNCKISKVGLRAYKLQKSGQVVISMRDYVRAAVSYDKNPCGFKFVSIHIANTSTGTKIQLIVRENQQLFIEAKKAEKDLYYCERDMKAELSFAASVIGEKDSYNTVGMLVTQQRVLKYTPMCFLPNSEFSYFCIDESKKATLPEFLHTAYMSDGRCTYIRGIYYAQLNAFISSDIEEKRNYCSAKQPYCLVYHGDYKPISPISRDRTLNMREANPKSNKYPQENQAKKEQISSAVVTMNADVIHIYMTLEELQHRYNLNAICKAKNEIAIKPGGTYILNGYYTPDKSFCCLKKVIMQDKSTLMRANISFVLEGAIARNDSDIKSLHLPILFKSHLRDEVKHKLTPIGYRQEDESSWSRYPDYMQVVIKMMMQERAEREKRFGKLAKFHPIEGVNLSYGLSQDKKVHLYSLFCHCSACIEKYGTDTIVDCNALVATRKGALERVTVQFCQGCGRYFMNYATFEAYNKRYGGILCECTFSNVNGQYENEFGFAPDSILSRCGYSVKAEISQDERQCILQFILDSGRASKWELQELMSRFINIRMNMPSMQGAIERWKEDIAFVADYKADAQTDVGIATIKQAGKIAPK